MARYDVNRLGRFSSSDPLAGSLGDPQSLNRYAYVRNDPISLIDPSGLSCSNKEQFRTPEAYAAFCPGGTGGGGVSFDCTLDGVYFPCDLAIRALGQGAAYLSFGPGWKYIGDTIYGSNCYSHVSDYVFCLGDLQLALNASNVGSGGDRWWKDFAKALFTQTYRRENETFGQCTDRAATNTVTALTGGLISSDKEAAAEVAASAAGVVGGLASIKSVPGTLGATGGWVRPSSVLGAWLFGTRSGVAATRIAFQGLFAVGAAEIGLRAGSALDCIQ